jgi:hypothetical protein
VVSQLLGFSELDSAAREHGGEAGCAMGRAHMICEGLAVVKLHSTAFVVRQRSRRDWGVLSLIAEVRPLARVKVTSNCRCSSVVMT